MSAVTLSALLPRTSSARKRMRLRIPARSITTTAATHTARTHSATHTPRTVSTGSLRESCPNSGCKSVICLVRTLTLFSRSVLSVGQHPVFCERMSSFRQQRAVLSHSKYRFIVLDIHVLLFFPFSTLCTAALQSELGGHDALKIWPLSKYILV